MNALEISKLIELKKRRAELKFKESVLGIQSGAELEQTDAAAARLERKAETAGLKILFPRNDKVEELNKKLAEIAPEQIKEALKTRSGEAYDILTEKGAIIKKNHENRLEIAKLSLIVAKAGKEEREILAGIIRSGSVAEPLKLETLVPENKEKLVKFLQRCGIPCVISESTLIGDDEANGKEVRIELYNRNVWVGGDKKEKLENNLKRIKEITPGIQLKNAQRHVKVFNEEEETEFTALQKEYLELLKEQDEILMEYDEEVKLSIKA